MKELSLRLALAGIVCLQLLLVPAAMAQQAGGGGARTGSGNSSPLVVPVGGPIRLIQPLDDRTTSLPPMQGINIAFAYFRLSWPWLVGTAAGLAVLQGVVAGVQIMMGGSPDAVEAGKTRFTWALGGMVLLGLAELILRVLNPTFYV